MTTSRNSTDRPSRRVVAEIVLSLDGRVNGVDGDYDMSWIVPHAISDAARDRTAAFTESATTVLLGRKNFEGFAGYWPSVADDDAADPRDRTFSRWFTSGVVETPDGAIWKVATSSKKDTGPATRRVDDIVLLLGVADVKASKRFYIDRGLTVKRSFGGKYVEFDAPDSHVKLALYARRALAKDAGVSPDGTGSHRIVIGTDAGTFTDPDGFAWETASVQTSSGRN